jgi:hypothetical protein
MVITPEHWADWLDPGNTELGQLQAAMQPAMAGGLTSRPVSMAVNSVRNNGPDLIKPLASDEPDDERKNDEPSGPGKSSAGIKGPPG